MPTRQNLTLLDVFVSEARLFQRDVVPFLVVVQNRLFVTGYTIRDS